MAAPLAATASANPIENSPAQVQALDQKYDHHHRHDKFNKAAMEIRVKLCHYRHNNEEFNNQIPVEVVKACADELGFDAQNDTFILVGEKHDTSVVKVIHDGYSYYVTLVHSDHGHWVVYSMD